MKRSNRLILLIGIVLAIVAFVAILFLFSSPQVPGTGGATPPPTELDTVIATVDIPLGTQVRDDMLTVKKVKIESRAADAVGDPTLVVGQIIRTTAFANSQITKSMFATSTVGVNPAPLLDKGQRAMTLQVDQVSGVGTLISIGDKVDAVVGFGGQGCGREFTLTTVDKDTGEITPVAGIGDNSVKLLLQNMKVVTTLLPPVEQTTTAEGSPAPESGGTALTGQQEIVGLAVTPQQAEVIKYAQINGCISLILRSPKDYVDDVGAPVEPLLDSTTGIIMKTLVDTYGVIPPQVVEAILPKK